MSKIPLNGIYIMFETGEMGHGRDRIVRVGTHTGDNQLPSRMLQHYVNENKDRSIFRKHIGRALLSRDGDPFLQQWNLDLTTSAAKKRYGDIVDFEKQRQVESRVTEYLQRNLRFVCFSVDDKTARMKWESRIISTVSWCEDCGPSIAWLGLHSPTARIRQSGLWIVNELYKEPLTERGLASLADIINNASWSAEAL
jgi:hypothetical protein